MDDIIFAISAEIVDSQISASCDITFREPGQPMWTFLFRSLSLPARSRHLTPGPQSPARHWPSRRNDLFRRQVAPGPLKLNLLKLGLIWGLVVLGLKAQLARAQEPADAAAPSRPVVALKTPLEDQHVERKVLVQQIIRQAFLLTAREHFHALTRDSALRETEQDLPKTAAIFEMRVTVPESPAKACTVTLKSLQSPTQVAEWTETFPNGAEELPAAVITLAGSWAQADFVTFLETAGLPVGPLPEQTHPVASDRPVTMDLLTSIGVLRQLHEELLVSPDSVDLLTAMAREYALLGTFTRCHLGAENKVFLARGLLYAERAVQQLPEDSTLAWNRALVLALTGLQTEAVNEIARARSLMPTTPAPDWSEALAAFVDWNLADLQTAVEKQSPLAAYLQMLAMQMAGSVDERLKAVNEVMQLQPECLSAAAQMASEDRLGLRRSVGQAQLLQLLLGLPQSLKKYASLPENVKKLLEEEKPPESQAEFFLQHLALRTALRDSTPESDPAEPSLTALNYLVSELQMLQATQMLETQRRYLGIDPALLIRQMEALLEHHPLASLCQVYSMNSRQDQFVYMKLIEDSASFAWGSGAAGTIQSLAWLRAPRQNHMLARIRNQGDDILPELIARLNYPATAEDTRQTLQTLQRMAPQCPAVIAWAIRKDKNVTGEQLETWEKASNSPIVLQALVDFYANSIETSKGYQPEAYERCLKKSIEVERTHKMLWKLADLYWGQGHEEKWEQTQLEALELPSFGLEEAQTAEKLAYYYMGQEEWNKARPVALRAAESYSAWGLICGSRCLEALGEWEESETHLKNMIERYNGSYFDWYLWCRRTGHGDVDAARTTFLDSLNSMSEKQRLQHDAMGVYSELEGDTEEAITIYENAFRSNPKDIYSGMSAALLRDQQKQYDQRDQLLDKIMSRERISGETLLANWIRRQPRESRSVPDPAILELFYTYRLHDRGHGTMAAWYIGRFLQLRGHEQEAVTWMQRAASSPEVGRYACTLAASQLQRLDIPVPRMRGKEFPAEFRAATDPLNRAIQDARPGNYENIDPLFRESIEKAPQLIISWMRAGDNAHDMEDYQRSRDMYAKALEMAPDEPVLMARVALNLEQLGQPTEAAAILRNIVKVSPGNLQALNNLGWLLATSSDADLRNGAEALEYARRARNQALDDSTNRETLLAAAFAENGEFFKAKTLISAVLSRHPQSPLPLKKWLELYENGQPYHRDSAKIGKMKLLVEE